MLTIIRLAAARHRVIPKWLMEGKPAVHSRVKQCTTGDIASALSRLRTINDPPRTTDKSVYQTVGVVHSMLHGLSPTRLRAPSAASPQLSAFSTAARRVRHRPGCSPR